MEVKQRFTVPRPPEQVWAFMGDVRAVAECVPGLALVEERDDGTYLGRFAIKVGPVSAKLEGEGTLARDDETRSARLEGKGVDKRGGSRVKGSLCYQVTAAEEGSAVEVDAEVALSGPLAQVGRSGIVEDVARSLTQEFAANLESRLSEEPTAAAGMPGPTAPGEAAQSTAERHEPAAFDAGGAAWRAIWQRMLRAFRRLFGRS